jgi:hypothetical protein
MLNFNFNSLFKNIREIKNNPGIIKINGESIPDYLQKCNSINDVIKDIRDVKVDVKDINIDNFIHIPDEFKDSIQELEFKNHFKGVNLTDALILYKTYKDLIDELKELGIKKNELGNISVENVVARVNYEKYINAFNDKLSPQRQESGTCYANATATVIHISLSKIFSREVDDFFTIRKNIITKYGYHGGNCERVLTDFCSKEKYNLKFKKVSEEEAKIAVDAKRPQIFVFALYDDEWETFSQFFKDHPCGILKKEHFKTNEKKSVKNSWLNLFDVFEDNQGILQYKHLKEEDRKRKLGGHAVVLMKSEKDHLYLMNSWGDNWGDKGYFRIENADVLNLSYSTFFYDVYWTSDMLSEEEISNFDKETLRKFRELQAKLPNGGVPVPYKCPLCKKICAVNQIFGDLKKAKCPICGDYFTPKLQDVDGKWLDFVFKVLNIY